MLVAPGSRQSHLIFLVHLGSCHRFDRLDGAGNVGRFALGQDLGLGGLRRHGGLLCQPVPESIPGREEDSPVEQEDDDQRDVEGGHGGEDLIADILADLKECLGLGLRRPKVQVLFI